MMYLYCDGCEARRVDESTNNFKYSVKRTLRLVSSDEIITCEDCLDPLTLYSGGDNDYSLMPAPFTQWELKEYVEELRIYKGAKI